MTGDGFVETYCSNCGFATRQWPQRNVAHESTEVVARGPELHAEFVAVRVISAPRYRLPRKVWIIAWLVALYAMYTTVVGQDWFLPIYFANGYLAMFAALLMVHRVLVADRFTEQMPQGVTAFMLLLLGSVVCALLLGSLAPTIGGEPNYCFTRAWRFMGGKVPPRVFRCTSTPLEFAGFVGGIWVIGWLMIRLKRLHAESEGG
jgi:hypothetical protein